MDVGRTKERSDGSGLLHNALLPNPLSKDDLAAVIIPTYIAGPVANAVWVMLAMSHLLYSL